MNQELPPASKRGGLRTKLILYHLLLTLGLLTLLTIAVLIAIQNSFKETQRQHLSMRAQYAATQYEALYRASGQDWDNLSGIIQSGDDPALAVIYDTNHHARILRVPKYLKLSRPEAEEVQQKALESLTGKTCNGYLQDTGGPGTFSGLYQSQPLYNNGQVIGAMFFAEPDSYPPGFSPGDFMSNVSRAILSVSIIAAIIVIFFSTMVSRRLTNPLVSLQRAAERLSLGDYTQRILLPQTHDEISQLAGTFNQMAERIETDVQEMRDQEQQRRALIANIAHDIATPLTTIQGFSEALADEMIPEKQAQKETAQVIAQEAQHLQRLVKEILHLSSLESGQVPLDCNNIDIVELINETITIIEPDCTMAGIAIKNEVRQKPLFIQVDSDKITQALLNILDNARQYTPPGGTITIGGYLEEEQLILWIRDTGIGISAEDLPRIFDRFFRADPARTRSVGNKGLGLSVVKAIIEAHRGTIRADSMPGHGTTIYLTLPMQHATL